MVANTREDRVESELTPAEMPKPSRAAPEDLQKIVANWRGIVAETTGMFKQKLLGAIPKYNGETGEPVLYVEFQDYYGQLYIDDPMYREELKKLIARRMGMDVEIVMVMGGEHQQQGLAQITVDEALRSNIHMDIEFEDEEEPSEE